jgi:hypothetical protein
MKTIHCALGQSARSASAAARPVDAGRMANATHHQE